MTGNAIFAIVLAAGAATRFGRTKQLEHFEGQSLAANAVRKAETVCGAHSVLVTGNNWSEVADTCAPLRGFFVVNEDFEHGLAGSIACGVRAVQENADAILLTLADLPLVPAGHLTALVETWRASPRSIVATAFEDAVGPPVVFPRTDFDALLALHGDRGARPVIEANRDRLKTIVCEEAAFDIDRPEDLAGIY